MKHLFLTILSLLIFIQGYSQQSEWYEIPDFMQVQAENRFDTINAWYITHIVYDNHDTIAKYALLGSAMQYADKTGDPAVKAGVTYLTGHFHKSRGREESGKILTEQAVAIAKKNNLKYEWACFMHDIGMCYYNGPGSDEIKCLEYFLRADEVFKEIHIERKPLAMATYLYDLGFLYYHLGNYNASVEALSRVMPHMDKVPDLLHLNLYNTQGLSYRKMDQDDSAMFFFEKTLASAKKANNTPWIGIASGNIGSIYFKKHQYDSALIYSTLDYEYVSRSPHVSGIGVAESLVSLADINTALHKPDKALANLTGIEKLITGQQIYYSPNAQYLLMRVYMIRSKAYEQKGDFRQAYHYHHMSRKMEDTVSFNKNITLYTKIHVQLEAENNIARIKKIESDTALSVQRRNFSLIALSLSGLILFSLYKRQQLSNKKNEEIFEGREQLFHLEKTRAEEQLSGYMSTLHEKNRLIEDFQSEIERLNSLPYSSEKLQTIETLEKLRETTIITDDDWTRFRALFEKAHKGFFVRLKQKYPDITPAEMRLLALVKLNVSTKQMADMLGISPDSIRKTGYRFIKKISAGGEAHLSEIVESL